MTAAQFHEIVADRWHLVAVVGAVLLITTYFPSLMALIRLYSIPLAGKDLGSHEKRRTAYLTGARKIYGEGYRKFKDGIFRITTSRKSPVIVVSPKFLAELKKLPDDIVSMTAAVDETMEVKYTRIDTYVPIIPHTIKAQLTPSLVRLNNVLHQEVQEAMSLELPATDEWKEVDLHKALLRIIGMVSGRVFIGPELCRSEEYLDAAINYTMDVMAAQRAVQSMRPWLRPLMAPRLPQVKKLDQRIAEAEAFMRPVVEARRKMAADPSVENPDDMLQWLMDNQSKFLDSRSQNLAKAQLGLGFAAIHTTTLTATNAFYDLAALPDIVPELREEAQAALDANGGVFTSTALQSMGKMDSLLKETLRVSPASMASFQRKVMKPFTLSNGQTIPAGVTIEVPAVAVNSDCDVFPDADRFDPLRFYNLRQQAREKKSVEAAAQNQFVSVSQDSLTFGYGRHACPGRFFAANEIKMIVACALMKYDFKNVDGCSTRYPNIEFAHMVS
ncbi:Cytochrome P450 [Geosmithia morbida]|uniref:Cytochrome P450 n=1 Tax=Geosmithia morbida TaxID=1094350 RepID=A0A9P4YRZ9_9HYPO|nr:Cytochrome P450 [Geosmithia morbida]KAF4120757.1 Cytochrome P450 [Geosmithia morbida]